MTNSPVSQWDCLNRKEAAQRIGVSYDTIRRAAKLGKVREIKFPGVTALLIPIEDIDALARGEVR